jgi:aminopeptidase N
MPFEDYLLDARLTCRAYGDQEIAAADGLFPLQGDKPRYPRDRVVDFKHVRLDVQLDLDAKRITGRVAHTFTPLNDGLTGLDLDAVGLEIGSVTASNGTALAHSHSDGHLHVDLASPMNTGEEETIAIEFSGSPRRGMYFIGPDANYPWKRMEVWTQGQDEDSRHWFPCYDYPNEMATTELHVSVREPFIVISNGELRGVDSAAGGLRTYHWHQEIPHVAYLTSIVAGEFAEIQDEWDGIPIKSYVPVGREEDGRAMVKNTAEMMKLFSERTGIRFPYAKYSQAVVQDFIFGGMENVSATTVTDLILFDQRARLEMDGDYLLAHEIAHQWFGDLLTCRDWSHGWLNEGFATFFELHFIEHSKGRDEFLYAIQNEIDSYLSEAATYRRPIVTNVYNMPLDIFDRHLYEKGGLVLNMLRVMLGETLFWKAIRRYALSRRGTNVVTPDLQRAIEESTGRNLDWFFDQWVFSPGHPELEGSYSWDEASKSAKLSLKQTQTGDKVPEVFRLPLRLNFRLESGETHSTTIEMTEREQTFYVPLAAKPKWFDVDGEVLKTMKLERPAEMLRAQLAENENVLGRVEAARALGKQTDKESIEALGKAAREDAFWAAQAEAGKALGAIRSNAAMEELLASLTVPHPKARRAIVRALGEFREERAAQALGRILEQGDPSYYVEAAATAAIGKTRAPMAFGAIERSLSKDSQNDVIRINAFDGLAQLRDERGVQLGIDWSRYGRPANVRGAACAALGQLGQVVPEHRKDEIVDHLTALIQDPWLRTQVAAINALAELKASKALPDLDRAAQSALDGRVSRSARIAAKKIRESGDKGDDLKKLREEFEKLTDENRTLKDRLDAIEARLPSNGA